MTHTTYTVTNEELDAARDWWESATLTQRFNVGKTTDAWRALDGYSRRVFAMVLLEQHLIECQGKHWSQDIAADQERETFLRNNMHRSDVKGMVR